MSRIIGLLMCLASIIWGYYEYQSATMLFGPLIGFLTGLSIVISTFDATDALLRKLLSKYTSEDERSARDASNRQAMLNRVRDFWVKGLLESSLHEEARIELGLEERRDAVAERPWDVILRTQGRPDCVLPPGTKISDVFERVGRSLLILGEPGAGKTTTLLELAREMIDRAERDPSEKIPIVFNLSSWTDPKQTLNEWMAEEMRDNYRIQKKIAETWIENDALLPLLDGLDEVVSERRAACIDAINGYLDEHSAQAVICCRKEEYEALDAELKLESAVLLQPLTPEQIDGYLERLSPDLGSLRQLLKYDRELQEFAKTPLILSIMTLAYRGMSIEELKSLGSIEDLRRHLLKTYVDRMFERTGRTDPKLYSKEDTIRWLSWLGRKMSENNQTVFLIERMQPAWLESKAQRRLNSILVIVGGGIICGLIGGLSGVLVGGLSGVAEWGLISWLDSVLFFGLIGVLIFGLIGGLTFGLIGGLEKGEIKPAEVLNYKMKPGREMLIGVLVGGLSGGLIFGLSSAVLSQIFRSIHVQIDVMNLGLRGAMFGGVLFGLGGGFSAAEKEMIAAPNQGILLSAKNAIILGLSSALIFGPIILVVIWSFYWPFFGMFFGLNGVLFFVVFFGVIVGMLFGGGRAVVQHFILRFILYREGLLPWKLVTFLDYATERIFLRKVGGGYVFVHRMLMEYFASLEPGTGRK